MTATGTTGKWIFRLLTIAVVVAVIAFAVGNRLMPDHRAEAFVANWAVCRPLISRDSMLP